MRKVNPIRTGRHCVFNWFGLLGRPHLLGRRHYDTQLLKKITYIRLKSAQDIK